MITYQVKVEPNPNDSTSRMRATYEYDSASKALMRWHWLKIVGYSVVLCELPSEILL